MSEHALKVQNISKKYKDGPQALNKVNLHIKPGEIFGLLGPNGAGKSTLINIISSIARKDEGQVQIYEHDLDQNPTEIKYDIGLVPQEISFDPFLTVEQTLQFQSGYFGIKDNQKYINEILEKLSLVDKRDARTRSLSGGMKRRLLIAKALVHKPRLVILDEPTAGVDVELRHNLWNYVTELNNQGTTVLLTTHYIEEAQNLCERVAIIDQGVIQAMDKTQTLIDKLGEEKILTLQLKNNLEKIPSVLEKYKVKLLADKHSLEICIKSDDTEHVFSDVIKAGLDIKNFQLNEQKLEDVFLKLTYDRNAN